MRKTVCHREHPSCHPERSEGSRFLRAGSRSLAALGMTMIALSAHAQSSRLDAVLRGIDAKQDVYTRIAQQIWTFAELGYQEQKSSALLQSELKNAGFTVTAGVVGEPTGFVASYGSGKPIIAIVGEFDALPGLSQAALPTKQV